MFHIVKRAWSDVLLPIFVTPTEQQVAALCYKDTDQGRKVLLITSRDTGRWIVPKGWPIEGKDGAGSALQEAWEEAGVRKAMIQPEPIGTYSYTKSKRNGADVPIQVDVYAAEVEQLKETYPEVRQRTREWFTPQEASKLVDEPELKEILSIF